MLKSGKEKEVAVLVLAIVFAVFSFSADRVFGSDDFVFARNLRTGSSGEDVRKLQEILNSDPATVVAKEGAGSPGRETNFFGALTKLAVIRFQEIYASDILAPLLLYKGTGFVGGATRKKLEAVGGELAVRRGFPPELPTKPAPGGGSYISATTSVDHPNLRNIDKFLEAINVVATQRGYGPEQILDLQQKAVQSVVSTTTDYALEFERQISGQNPAVSSIGSILAKDNFHAERGFFSVIPIFLENLSPFSPKTVYAQSGSEPFGGMILFYFYCTCSGKWLMTLQPTAPNYVVLITHMMGMQRYLNFNVPFSRYLLGFYDPGDGDCRMQAGYSCITLPSQGKTTMTLGSS
ncbi:MAG: hypothetical protein A3G59_01535 [Candidatus Taylorbacteria bacterium RIFCSPLOWO2_12_FULL_47_20]|uniref:Peptidoglycan binding-like domain-containing protein n=2 Tax=Candidatus Tayloriibacteriota TaxID=1817919 RepID=A0A1G2P8T5_9BACT|nr:MAG: hypothetical protein A3H68_01115 [Candidatus Taylorbacteria bacterium RIFCSPLOWO2_02_FULL_46_40]OHA43981.1 MAG: hypothetical protein A3G59_01535 [Candidatus Taylorbacteria bacterium RIFCSPLOWO2_12_FULL_47_20]